MPEFLFKARDGSGALATGSVIADSVGSAVTALRSEGKYPTSVTLAEERRQSRKSLLAPEARLSRKDLLQFGTQLQIMIETGVTLSEALESIATQSHKPNVRQVIGDLGRQVVGGDSFSLALSRQPRSFPRMMVALVAASEKSGLMARLLGRAVAYLRDEQETLRRVRGALTYPAIMFVFAMSTTCFLMTFVLPKFTAIYASKGAALPMMTQLLMAISSFLIGYWPWIVGVVVAGAVGFWQGIKTAKGRRLLNRVQLKTPVVGPIIEKLHLSRGLRLIGTMAGAGINLPDCVKTAGELCPNVFFQELWTDVGVQIQSGKQFSAPLFQSDLVPKGIAQMLHSAEKGGKLAAVMEQVSGFAEEELKAQIAEMTRYIEPAMILVMGAIIGTVALALLLPIFTISQVIAR